MFTLYIVLVLIFGFIICYDDLKHGLIKNKYILIILTIFIFHFITNLNNLLNINFLIYLLWTLFIGFFMYMIDLWSAGDSKFFISLSLFLPSGLISLKISLDFLINSFVPFFFGFVIILLIKSKKDEIKKQFKSAFSLYNIFIVSSMYLGFVWFLILPLRLIGLPINIFTVIIFLFIVLEGSKKITSVNMEYFYVILVLIRVILDYRNIFNFTFLVRYVSILLVFLFFRFFIIKLAFKSNVEKIKIENLKPGMEIAEGIRKRGNKYEKIKLLQISLYDFLLQKKEKFIHSKILTENDVKKMRKMRKEGEIPFNNLLIHKPILFALFLYTGFIITLILRSDFISALFV